MANHNSCSALEIQLMELNVAYDCLRQEFHETSSELKVANLANSDLMYELELMTKENDRIRNEQRKPSQQQEAEIKELKGTVEQLLADKEQMQECIDSLSERLRKPEMEPRVETEITSKPDVQHLDQIKIKMLTTQLLDTEEKLYQLQEANTGISEQFASLSERYDALQSNYDCVKHEVDELQKLLQAAQQHSALLIEENVDLKCSTDTDRKGNSLFAEVADQRKGLLQIIEKNRECYYALKAEHKNCSHRIETLRNELTKLDRRIEIYLNSIGSAEKEYVRALKQLNNSIMEDFQKQMDRNNILKQQLANNSDNWVKSLVKYSTEEINEVRSRLMECLTKCRQAEDEHQWRAKELEHVRAELTKLMQERCHDHFDVLLFDTGATMKKESKDALDKEVIKPLSTSNTKMLENLECSHLTETCESLAEVSIKDSLPESEISTSLCSLASDKIKGAACEEIEEKQSCSTGDSEHAPGQAKIIPNDTDDTRIGLNERKPLIVRRIQLIRPSSKNE